MSRFLVLCLRIVRFKVFLFLKVTFNLVVRIEHLLDQNFNSFYPWNLTSLLGTPREPVNLLVTYWMHNTWFLLLLVGCITPGFCRLVTYKIL